MFAVDLADTRLADKICNCPIEGGYILGNHGSMFRIDPQLFLNESQYAEFIDEFREVITFIKSAGWR